MKSNLSIVTGSGEVVKVNENLYQILDKLPPPISKMNLSKDQKYWYNYFGQQLIDSKKLTKPDLIHLHRLAKSIDYYIQAENQISNLGYFDGLIQVFKGGATNVSGHVTIREKMIKEIDELSKHFGFSFKDRQKLKDNSNTNPAQTDLFDDFMRLKQAQ